MFNQKEYDKKKYQKNKEKIKLRVKKYVEENPEKVKKAHKKWKEKNPEYQKEYDKKYKKENPEKRKNYYQEHQEEAKEYGKEYYQEHIEKIKKQKKRHYQEHKEKEKEKSKKYKKENPEKVKKYKRKWEKNKRKINPQFCLNGNISTAIGDSLRGQKAGRHWETLVGYTLQKLIMRLEYQFDKNMNWENYGSYWQIDHKKPKSLFHFKSVEEQTFHDCWCLANLQPLEKTKNRKKYNHFKGRSNIN